MISRLAAAAALLLLGAGALAAANESPAAQRLAERFEPIETLTAEFTQTVSGARGRVLERSTGELFVARPMRFRWEVRAPHPQLVVTADDRVYVHDPELAQVNIEPLDEALEGTPALVLAGSVEQIDAQFVVDVQERDGAEVFLLRPRAPDALFRELRLTFADDRLARLEIIDALDQHTEVLLEDLRINEPIEPERFTFVIPPDTDVIGDEAAPIE